jgi:hypothetical protein
MYCHLVCVWLLTGFGLVIGFIDHLQVVTTNNYNTITDFHTFQITVSLFQPALISLNISWQQLLTMVPFELKSCLNGGSHITSRHGPRQHNSSIAASGFVSAEMCLRRRCLAMAAARTTENTVSNSSSVVACRVIAMGTCLWSLPSNGSSRYSMNIFKKFLTLSEQECPEAISTTCFCTI